MNNMTRIHALILLTVSVCALVLSLSNLLGVTLPLPVRTLILAVLLPATCALIYYTVKLLRASRRK